MMDDKIVEHFLEVKDSMRKVEMLAMNRQSRKLYWKPGEFFPEKEKAIFYHNNWIDILLDSFPKSFVNARNSFETFTNKERVDGILLENENVIYIERFLELCKYTMKKAYLSFLKNAYYYAYSLPLQMSKLQPTVSRPAVKFICDSDLEEDEDNKRFLENVWSSMYTSYSNFEDLIYDIYKAAKYLQFIFSFCGPDYYKPFFDIENSRRKNMYKTIISDFEAMPAVINYDFFKKSIIFDKSEVVEKFKKQALDIQSVLAAEMSSCLHLVTRMYNYCIQIYNNEMDWLAKVEMYVFFFEKVVQQKMQDAVQKQPEMTSENYKQLVSKFEERVHKMREPMAHQIYGKQFDADIEAIYTLYNNGKLNRHDGIATLKENVTNILGKKKTVEIQFETFNLSAQSTFLLEKQDVIIVHKDYVEDDLKLGITTEDFANLAPEYVQPFTAFYTDRWKNVVERTFPCPAAYARFCLLHLLNEPESKLLSDAYIKEHFNALCTKFLASRVGWNLMLFLQKNTEIFKAIEANAYIAITRHDNPSLEMFVNILEAKMFSYKNNVLGIMFIFNVSNTVHIKELASNLVKMYPRVNPQLSIFLLQVLKYPFLDVFTLPFLLPTGTTDNDTYYAEQYLSQYLLSQLKSENKPITNEEISKWFDTQTIHRENIVSKCEHILSKLRVSLPGIPDAVLYNIFLIELGTMNLEEITEKIKTMQVNVSAIPFFENI